MSNSINIQKDLSGSKILLSHAKKKLGRSGLDIRQRVKRLMEDIVNVNFNNRAEIFKFMLDKVNQNRSYFLCGFDLFHINNFNTNFVDERLRINIAENHAGKKKLRIQEAVRWLSRPYTVQPDSANVFSFVAFLVKNNAISKKRQVVLLRGPKASGKSTQLAQVLDFFRFLGKVEFLGPGPSLQQTRTKKYSENEIIMDDYASGGGRNRAISANKQPKVISRLEEHTLRVKVLNLKASPQEERAFVNDACLAHLTRGLKALQLLTSSVGPDGKRTSNAAVSMRIKLEEGVKQCLLRRGQLGINFFLTTVFENKRLGGFESFYGFLEATDSMFLNAYGLKKKVQSNAGLYFDISLKPKFAILGKMWRDFVDGLPKKLKRSVQKTMCAMLMFLNLKTAQVTKECSYLALLLEVDKDSIINYFKLKEGLGEREMVREIKAKGRRAAEVLYRALVDSVMAYFNLEMRELCECTLMESEDINKFDLEFIDFLGYQDHQMDETAKRPRENGKYEFVCNWLNEKLFRFYTMKKFRDSDKGDLQNRDCEEIKIDQCLSVSEQETKSDIQAGNPDFKIGNAGMSSYSSVEHEKTESERYATESGLKYVKNDDIIRKIEGPEGVLAMMKGTEYQDSCLKLGDQFVIFLKRAMQFLNQSTVRDSSLKGEDYYLDFQHFFAETVNYDLRSVFELTVPQSEDYNKFWEDVFSGSSLLLNFKHWKVEEVLESKLVKLKIEYGLKPKQWKQELHYATVLSMIETDSDVDDVLYEWRRFISGLGKVEDLYFINCLRVGKVDTPKKIEKELYKTFDGMDLESLIEFYKTRYTIRFSYDYFYKKFGLQSILSNLLGDSKSAEDERRLADISKQMLKLILPEEGEYILGQHELRVKQKFLSEIEIQLQRLSDNKSLQRIMQRLVTTAFRAKIRNQNRKAFQIAEHVLLQKTKRRTWEVVQEAKEKFMAPIDAMRERRNEEFIAARYKSMAEKLVEQALEEEMGNNVKVIQRHWRNGLKIKAAKKELERRRKEKKKSDKLKELEEKRIKQLKELEAKRAKLLSEFEEKKEALMVLKQFYRSQKMLSFFRHRREMIERIRRLFRRVLFGKRLAKRILKKKKQKMRLKMEGIEQEFVSGFLDQLKYKDRMRKAPKAYRDKWATGAVVLPKIKLSLQQVKQIQLRTATLGLFLTKVQEGEDVMSFSDNLSRALNHLTSDNDAVLKIHIQKETTLITTVKQRLYLFSNYTDAHLGVSLPSKCHFIYYVGEFLYFVDESLELRVKYLPLYSKAEFRPGSKEAVFEFSGFQQLKIRGKFFIGLTTCDKLCLKDDILDESSSIRIIQFRRKLVRVDCGKNFIVCLDAKGVLYSGGDNSYGQLGLGHRKAVQGVVPIEDLSYRKAIIKSFSCGKRHVLAVTGNNQLFAWGDNSLGQVNPLFSKISKDSELTPEEKENLIIDRPIKVFEALDFVPKGEHRIQVKAGKTSSFVLSSDAKLFCFGSPSDFKTNERVVQWDLRDVYGPDFWPVSLEVEWSARVELVYFRFIDGGAKMLGNTPLMRKIHRSMFASFMVSGGSALLRYSGLSSKYVNVRFMSSKLTELANHRQRKKLQKHKDRTWNYIMLSKNHLQNTQRQS